MDVKTICRTIKNLFTRIRVPAPDISRILTVCNGPNKVGLSALESTAKIVKDLDNLGIYTGKMPDGSVNLTVGFVYAMVKENQRAIKEDMKVEVGLQPGSIMIQVGNLIGTNINTGTGYGSPH